jgi:G3E family GTPase
VEERIPVVVLTGFLGSGKTTLLNRWLSERKDVALIINELGDIGIDQHLTGTEGVSISLLAGGCLCCVIQGSLSTTLRNLFMARKNGDIPAFMTVVIETTGAAEPFGVVAPLEQDPWLRKRFVCQSVLTVVDARAGAEAIAEHPEVLEQIHGADVLLLSKAEQAEPPAVQALQAQLKNLNASARQYRLDTDFPDAGLLDESFPRRCRVTGLFAPVGGVALAAQSLALVPAEKPASRHNLFSASLRWPHGLDWPLWLAALQQLQAQCGDALVRVKGLLQVNGLDGPMLVQWVAQQAPEMTPQNLWPDQDTDSRLVLIARHPQADFPARLLAHWEALLNQLQVAPSA